MFSRSLRPLHRVFSTTPYRKADPWPLPHTKQHIESTTISPNIPRPIPIPRHDESLDTLRARLTYQTRKRGTLESDLIMSTFAKEHLHSLTREELVELDQVTYPETEPILPVSHPAGLIVSERSYLTNRIGTCIIGAPTERRLHSVGPVPQFSPNSKSTPEMKARQSAACPISTHRSVLRDRT